MLLPHSSQRRQDHDIPHAKGREERKERKKNSLPPLMHRTLGSNSPRTLRGMMIYARGFISLIGMERVVVVLTDP